MTAAMANKNCNFDYLMQMNQAIFDYFNMLDNSDNWLFCSDQNLIDDFVDSIMRYYLLNNSMIKHSFIMLNSRYYRVLTNPIAISNYSNYFDLDFTNFDKSFVDMCFMASIDNYWNYDYSFCRISNLIPINCNFDCVGYT